MMFARIVLLLLAFAFGGIGAAFLVAPTESVSLTEVVAPSPTARADIRAQYGGFQVGYAVFLLVCLGKPERVALASLANTLVLLAFTLTHVSSLIADGPVAEAILVSLLLEASGAVLSAVGWWLARKVQQPAPSEDW